MLVSVCVQSWSVANNWTATSYLCYREKMHDAVQPLVKNGWVSWCQENSYQIPQWLKKADRTSSHLLVGHYEERPIISQPQCGRCHRVGTGRTTLEVIGSRSLHSATVTHQALNWCKPNNDDDDTGASTITTTGFPLSGKSGSVGEFCWLECEEIVKFCCLSGNFAFANETLMICICNWQQMQRLNKKLSLT